MNIIKYYDKKIFVPMQSLIHTEFTNQTKDFSAKLALLRLQFSENTVFCQTTMISKFVLHYNASWAVLFTVRCGKSCREKRETRYAQESTSPKKQCEAAVFAYQKPPVPQKCQHDLRFEKDKCQAGKTFTYTGCGGFDHWR